MGDPKDARPAEQDHLLRRSRPVRVDTLRHVEFVAQLYDDMFGLTHDGRLYLDGKMDADSRPWPPGEQILRQP